MTRILAFLATFLFAVPALAECVTPPLACGEETCAPDAAPYGAMCELRDTALGPLFQCACGGNPGNFECDESVGYAPGTAYVVCSGECGQIPGNGYGLTNGWEAAECDPYPLLYVNGAPTGIVPGYACCPTAGLPPRPIAPDVALLVTNDGAFDAVIWDQGDGTALAWSASAAPPGETAGTTTIAVPIWSPPAGTFVPAARYGGILIMPDGSQRLAIPYADDGSGGVLVHYTDGTSEQSADATLPDAFPVGDFVFLMRF